MLLFRISRFIGFIITACLWPSMLLYAQNTGTVHGRLVENGSKQPVSFATVVLLRAADSSFAAGMQADAEGMFEISKVPFGQYVLKVTAVGYRTGRQAVTLTDAQAILSLGTLHLRPTATELSDVTVTAERNVINNSLDKQVIKVSKDLTAIGGTAIDLLQNVPSVSIDENGAVSIRGSAGVTILIDGKQTGTTLEQIPASSIESIEVITNPSAKYDASGAAGILNIILKKDLRNGLNGQATTLVGTGDKYNGSLNLNYRKGKLNLFGSYDLRRDRRWIRASLAQSTTAKDSTLVLNQERSGYNIQTSHAIRLGFDYAISPMQTFTFAVQPRFNFTDNSDMLHSRQENASAADRMVNAGSSDRSNSTAGINRSADISIDYKRNWGDAQKGRELSANAVFTPLFSANKVVSDINYLLSNPVLQHQNTVNRTLQGSAQADYVHPLGEKSRFEAGLRSTYRKYDIDYTFSSDPELSFNPSNRFIYKQYVQAAYGLYGNAIGKFSWQAGLRAELSNLNGEQTVSRTKFTQQYLTLFPGATIAYDFPKDLRVQLGYSKRIGRPDANELNPFTDRSDQLNLVKGNPNLQPEYVHSFELGAQKGFAGGAELSATAFTRIETQTIKDFRQVIIDALTGNTVTLNNPQNIGTETSTGIDMAGSAPMNNWWKLNGSASLFYRTIIGSYNGVPINTASLMSRVRLNNVFTVSRRCDIQLALNYRSPVNTAQGKRSTAFNVDIAAKYNVFGTRGTISLRVADVFNTLRYNITSDGADFSTNSRFKRESRIAFLGFTYRFGKIQNGGKERRSNDEGANGFD